MILLSIVLLVSGAGQAGATPPERASAPKMICCNIELTGSIMDGHRLCKTKEDWQRFDQGNNDRAKLFHDRIKSGLAVRLGE